MNYIHLVLVITGLTVEIFGATMKRMSMLHRTSADLETSGSGYIYTEASGHPTSYVQFTSNVAAQPIVHHQHVVPIVQYYEPKESIEVVGDDHESLEVAPAELEEDEPDKYSDSIEDDDSGDDDDDGGDGKGEEFDESEGAKYEKSSESAHGEKGNKGYKNKHEYSKGEKGAHSQEHDQGFYKEKGAKKSGHHDSAGHYNKHYAEGKGEKGEKSGSSDYHKKGQKTTGYHNVYRKDEYKKDHSFYDEADKRGFYKKHQDYDAYRAAEKGGHEKGAHSNAAYQEKDSGKKGSFDQGHYDQNDQGQKSAYGHDAHHSSYADFAKHAAKEGGAEYAHKS